MARSRDNMITHGLSGAVGKELVFKKHKKETIVTDFPDMSNIKPSKNQTKERNLFGEAVAFAKKILKDPEQIARYQQMKTSTPYHAAIKDYLARFNRSKTKKRGLPARVKSLSEEFALSDHQIRAMVYILDFKEITNKVYQTMSGLSKPTATRHLRELVRLNIIKSNGGKGAGAFYEIGSALKK